MTVRSISAVLAALLACSGCATYEPDPLDPAAEFAALARRDVAGLVLTHAAPGEGGSPRDVPFDPSDGLDEEELVAVALTLSPEIRATRMEIGQAQVALIEAGLFPNPEAGVSWQEGLGAAPASTLDLDLLAALLRPGERAARVDVATARIEEVRASIAAAEWELVREVRSQRLELLAAEREVELLRQGVTLRARALELVRHARALGEVTDLEVSATELELAEGRRELRRAETDAASARSELNRVVGLPPGFVVDLGASGHPLTVTVFEDVADAELDRRLLAGRFDLRALLAAHARAEHELRLAVLRQFPAVRIGPSFGREPEGDGRNYLGLGAEIELPLFDRNQGEIAEREAQRAKARADYVAALHDLQAQAHLARERLRRARAEVEAQDAEVLPLVRRNEELFEGAFRAGQLNVLDWVAAQGRVLRAREQYLETVVRYQRSVIELETVTGTSLRRPATPGGGASGE